METRRSTGYQLTVITRLRLSVYVAAPLWTIVARLLGLTALLLPIPLTQSIRAKAAYPLLIYHKPARGCQKVVALSR